MSAPDPLLATHPSTEPGDVPATGSVPDASPTLANLTTTLPQRYELRGEIGRGGMGAILRVHDRSLHRDLAVKVLLEPFADRPALVRRFLEEAQIAGQLQHPGVVPV